MPKPKEHHRNWHAAFLEAFAQCGIVNLAARQVKISANAVEKAKQRSPRFREAYFAAKENATQMLEAEMMRRAKIGIDEPVTIAGQREVVKKYSDSLLMFMLKALRPQVYRDNYNLALSNPDGSKLSLAPQQTVMALIQTDPEIARVALKLAEAQVIDFDAAKLLKAPADEKQH
jgi:hypothetical protein